MLRKFWRFIWTRTACIVSNNRGKIKRSYLLIPFRNHFGKKIFLFVSMDKPQMISSVSRHWMKCIEKRVTMPRLYLGTILRASNEFTSMKIDKEKLLFN